MNTQTENRDFLRESLHLGFEWLADELYDWVTEPRVNCDFKIKHKLSPDEIKSRIINLTMAIPGRFQGTWNQKRFLGSIEIFNSLVFGKTYALFELTYDSGYLYVKLKLNCIQELKRETIESNFKKLLVQVMR